MTRTILLLAAVTLTMCGCSPKVQVASDRCWRGTFGNNSSVEGCGNRSYSMPRGTKCASFYLKSATGFVQARIDKGAEAVRSALEMADLFSQLRTAAQGN